MGAKLRMAVMPLTEGDSLTLGSPRMTARAAEVYCCTPLLNLRRVGSLCYASNSRCQFINLGMCLSQSRANSSSVARLAMSVASMPS